MAIIRKITQDQEAEICNLYISGKPSIEIAKIFNTSYVTIIKYLRKNNIEIRKTFSKIDSNLIINDYLSGLTGKKVAEKNNISISLVSYILKKYNVKVRPRASGPDNPLWRGGTYKDIYKYIILNDKSKQHRTLIEDILQRKLFHWECVHHINGKKDDNDLSNLVAMPMREHTRFHNFLYFRGLEISKENLIKYARQESEVYFRFTKKDFDLHSGINKKEKIKKKQPICKYKGCDNESYGKTKICNKHYQRERAIKRGYWLAGKGRKSKFLIKE